MSDLRARIEALPRWDKRTVPGGLHVRLFDVLVIVAEDAALLLNASTAVGRDVR